MQKFQTNGESRKRSAAAVSVKFTRQNSSKAKKTWRLKSNRRNSRNRLFEFLKSCWFVEHFFISGAENGSRRFKSAATQIRPRLQVLWMRQGRTIQLHRHELGRQVARRTQKSAAKR